MFESNSHSANVSIAYNQSGYKTNLIHHTNLTLCTMMRPYLVEHFKKYTPSQKLVCLKLFTSSKVYDKDLFESFIQDLTAKDSKPCWYIRNPITNEEIDYFYDVIDVLDFATKYGYEWSPKTMRSRSVLIQKLLAKIKNSPSDFIHYDENLTMVRGVYPDLIPTSEQENSEKWFYNEILDLLVKELSRSQSPRKGIYGMLKRLEQLVQYESNLNQTRLEQVVKLSEGVLA